jgi:predicted transcriptional regulator
LKAVFRKFSQFDFKVTFTGRAPFDFIARCPEKGLKIIGGVADYGERNLGQRIREVKSLGEVIGAHAVFISYEGSQDEGVPLICHKVFNKMECAEELFTQLD